MSSSTLKRPIASLSAFAAAIVVLTACSREDPDRAATPSAEPSAVVSASPPPDLTAGEAYGPVSLVCAALDVSALREVAPGDQSGHGEWLVGEDRLLNSCALTPLFAGDDELLVTVRLMADASTVADEVEPLPEGLGSLTDVSTGDYRGTVHAESDFPKDDGTYVLRITLWDENMIVEVALSVTADEEERVTRPLITTMASAFAGLRR